MSLKILMVSFDYLPNIGGIASHILYLSQALESLGHKITILNPVFDQTQPSYTINTEETPIRTIRITIPRHRNKLATYYAKSKGVRKGLNHIRETYGEHDIIHQHDYVDSASGIRFINNKTPKIIWTNHSSHFLNDQFRRHKLNFIKFIYSNVNGIISVSQERYDAAKLVFSKEMTYIANGVDTKIFAPSSSQPNNSKFTLLCPCRISKVKGQAYLAKAINILAASCQIDIENKFKFILIGADSAPNTDIQYINYIKNSLSSHIDSGLVELHGNIPPDQMPSLIQSSSTIVMPSLMEGISLATLEAMAMKKPVIASNVGGMPEIIENGKTGLLVPARDPEALADTIIRLYNDIEIQKTLAENAYDQVVNGYTWRHVAENTVKFYQKALDQ